MPGVDHTWRLQAENICYFCAASDTQVASPFSNLTHFCGFTTGSVVVLRWLWSWLPPLLPRSSSLWTPWRGVVLLSLYSGVPCQVSGKYNGGFLIRMLNMQIFFSFYLLWALLTVDKKMHRRKSHWIIIRVTVNIMLKIASVRMCFSCVVLHLDINCHSI